MKKLRDLKNSVYLLVSQIKKGEVTTYGQIAKKLHIRSARTIGRILHQNMNLRIPCHRVVFADGSLSKSYAFGGMKKQKEKLLKEGVLFKGEKVDIAKIKNNTRNLL